MKILSINAGSSSLKFSLFQMPEEIELISGNFERIGLENSFYTIEIEAEKIKKEILLDNHKRAFEILVDELINKKQVDNLDEVIGIGHRLVHGGDKFSESVIATEEAVKEVEALSSLAPLHNPPAIAALKSAIEVFPKANQVLVFDTAFHQTMKETEYLYPVPYAWYEKYGVRKYGFHGTSHKYVANKGIGILNKVNSKIITCHIGNGCSISAIKDGKCVDTSMGLTPNAGLMMGTRSGDIDANIMPYIMEKENLTITEVEKILNKDSGLLGICGYSDLRDIEIGIENGNKMMKLAHDMYASRIAEYIAKYYVLLAGCDMIVFTAGIGEKGAYTRKEVINRLGVLDILLDEDANEKAFAIEAKISANNSKTLVYVIPTNEELMIGIDTYNLINKKG